MIYLHELLIVFTCWFVLLNCIFALIKSISAEICEKDKKDKKAKWYFDFFNRQKRNIFIIILLMSIAIAIIDCSYYIL